MYNDTSHTVSVLRPSIRHVKGYKIINLSGPSPWRSLIGVSNLPDKLRAFLYYDRRRKISQKLRHDQSGNLSVNKKEKSDNPFQSRKYHCNLVTRFTGLDSLKQENILLILCSKEISTKSYNTILQKCFEKN